MSPALAVITDRTLTYQQKVAGLARVGESTESPLRIGPELRRYIDAGAICDLYEGSAPYRPRYIVPDYERFMSRGSAFLGLEPPRDIWEATAALLVLYRHVPSITTFPVYLGDIDALLQPFVADEAEARKAIGLFLLSIDRTINDSFCHADIGPDATAAGRLILELTREQKNAVPNLSLKYEAGRTPDDFAALAASVALEVAKPSFANHAMFGREFRDMGLGDYAIASCYNGLPKGGGSCTLVRLNLAKAAPLAAGLADFSSRVLPDVVARQLEYMDERVRFLVAESGFFESSFLVKEGLVRADRFSAMFGIVGLAECVNAFSGGARFGKSDEADALGLEIIERIAALVAAHRTPLLAANGGAYLLHAQVGIDDDRGVSPGCRIPIGEEPDLPEHILRSAPFHRFFPSGIGDVFAFEPTAKANPRHLLDIAKGALASGLRYFSAYAADADVVRITGYLVKRSEIERLGRGEQSLQDTTALGRNAVNNLGVLERRIRS
ncbi:MAG: YjjI family glycine radical enzyme [Spirochaetes bacterium]|nr:YjjI family glycine radical enzyme [Spirochaetota bacterium]MBU1079341.1 YjjI family glycine radical enzyme [Spirochaetota bacterium]